LSSSYHPPMISRLRCEKTRIAYECRQLWHSPRFCVDLQTRGRDLRILLGTAEHSVWARQSIRSRNTKSSHRPNLNPTS
jgi:hypothetical protein